MLWFLPLIAAALGAGAGQAKTHHTKGTLEGAGLGALAGMGAAELLGSGAAGAGAAGAGSGLGAAGDAGLGTAGATGAGSTAAGSDLGLSALVAGGGTAPSTAGAITAASAPSAAETAANAALASHPALWARLGEAGAKGMASTAAGQGTLMAMTPKVKTSTPEQMPFAPMSQMQQQQPMSMPSYMDQLRQLGFA